VTTKIRYLPDQTYCRLGDAFSLEHDSFNRFGQRP